MRRGRKFLKVTVEGAVLKTQIRRSSLYLVKQEMNKALATLH
jgi:hypothetical protein